MRIAVIGGIGSGKSVVLRTAKEMGFATLSCDEINAELLSEQKYLDKLFELFPSSKENGKLNKAILKNIIYNDLNARERLNSLSHPLIYEKILNDKRDPLVVEIPLFENNLKEYFDHIIFVNTPLEKRISFLFDNRNMDRSEALSIIKSQPSSDELKAMATIVIDNNEDKDSLVNNTKMTFGLIK